MDANLERCRGLFSDLLRDAYAKNTTQDQCIGAAEAGAYLLGEIERLRAALEEIASLLGRAADSSERAVLRYAAFKTARVALGHEQSQDKSEAK